MQKGLFITFEGNDGSGKTTISQRAYEQLKNAGYPVIYTREPGGIDIAEQIRQLILHPANTAMDARCEALLYAASRRQHLVEKVIPALMKGNIVLCDRFLDSSLAYQGVARGIGMDEVLQINEFAIEGHMPDATIFLAIDVALGLKRVSARGNLDRLDQEGRAFHTLVAKGYEMVKQRFSSRIHVVNANQEIDQVFTDTMQVLEEIIKPYV